MSAFGTTKASRPLSHGAIADGAKARAQRRLEDLQISARKESEPWRKDVEQKATTPQSAVVTPFLPPVDAAKAGRAGCVSMAHVAAHKGDLRELKRLLDAGFPIDDLAGGWSLVHCAAAGRRLAALELLLDEGADPDVDAATASDVYERGTPLTVALRRGFADVAAALLARGADVRRGAAETPLHVACDRGDVAAARALVAAGADATAEDDDGDSPLDRAALACRLRFAFDEATLAALADALGLDAP